MVIIIFNKLSSYLEMSTEFVLCAIIECFFGQLFFL